MSVVDITEERSKLIGRVTLSEGDHFRERTPDNH
jgi:hypothetical protein